MFEFHVSRDARDHYQFDQTLFSFNGNAVLADFQAARVFAQKMNAKRDLLRQPEKAVRASEINAMGLIDEILHLMIDAYRRQVNPTVNREALNWLGEQLGSGSVDETLRRFSELFPPVAVYRQEKGVDEYLQEQTGELSHSEVALEEMLMLWMANLNPAFSPHLELFDDDDLEKRSAYLNIMEGLGDFFGGQPGLEAGGESLIDMLKAPMKAAPDSLAGQLEFVRQRWTPYLGAKFTRLLSSLDFIAEEHKASFSGPGPINPLSFAGQEDEAEAYSPDREWMPRLVLLAKNAYVWLNQLSKTYQRPISTLDQIPDEELDALARRGITGLWLIGLWERSKASARIKQIMGNPEAVASAYSLYDYDIAGDLGGTAAMDNLRQRAWQRGIRMASDMVPNHMAIDSRWVVQHPDWFLSLPYSPFPGYSFSGVDLCGDERVSVRLEDHYFDRTDAAVVFQRVDNWTGDVRYIYHGNDGTQMPWNDTAQLNYLKAEVREAVIQTILHVARQFPIIRFDAAMTLAKRHVQRLWFPEPGSGGDIASRAEHGMSKADFDAAMPEEFWREVVDRVAAEVPDTLLLAEAFWLMEGYFVRTLGMHRVYNSAFMHMLRDEDNDKYRTQIKNTLEFDPEILKRYVNFMSNPDEETAVAQFGKGDKYFGVATVMATVPGLPMFGHGQFEGYAEKYGMEYRRAYHDETPDQWLLDRHEREITPVLKRRYLFADVLHFRLYDFYNAAGQVDEDVLAFSNRAGTERSLVVYHNKFADAHGWIRTSASYLDKGSGQMRQQSLAEGLQIPHTPDTFLLFRDLISGQEYIRDCHQLAEKGLYIELGAYQRHVFLDIREVHDADGQYRRLHDSLAGRGVASIEEAIQELHLQALHRPFRALVSAENLRWLFDNRQTELPEAGIEPWSEQQNRRWDELEAQALDFLTQARITLSPAPEIPDLDVDILARRVRVLDEAASAATATETVDPALASELSESLRPPEPELSELAQAIVLDLKAVLALPALAGQFPRPRSGPYTRALSALLDGLADDLGAWSTLSLWAITRRLGELTGAADAPTRARSLLDDWLLAKIIGGSLRSLGLDEAAAGRALSLLKLLVSHQDWAQEVTTPQALLMQLFNDLEAQQFMGVNRFDEVLWYSRAGFSGLLHGLYATAVLTHTAAADAEPKTVTRSIINLHKLVAALLAADETAEYRVEKLLAGLESERRR